MATDSNLNVSQPPSSFEIAKDPASQRIKALYSDLNFPGSGSALHTFYNELKKAGKDEGFTLDQVHNILSTIPTFLMQVEHTPKSHPRRHVETVGQGTTFQCDIAFLPETDTFNSVFCLIDLGSHFAYAEPLINKKPSTVLAALKKMIKENPKELSRMSAISMDQGSEWKGVFKKWCDRQNIRLYLLNQPSHAAVIEQWIRTLKSRLMTLARSHLTDQWPNFLKQVVSNINHSYCRSIEGVPAESNSIESDPQLRERHEHDQLLRSHERKPNQNLPEPQNLEVGSFVYLDVTRTAFDKSFDFKRTRIYEITHIDKLKTPWLYTLKECFSNKIMNGSYYGWQLIKAPSPSENPDAIYLVKDVLAKRHLRGRPKEVLVSWLFYPSS